jgi:GntR family transcriptional regulator, transcriptional repressor for pyruvate dehydrogenase complex
MIEGAIAASVAPAAKPKALETLRVPYERMVEDVANGRVPIAADGEFHLGVAQMSGNDVLLRMLQYSVI